tara:strand:+ start:4345 stop:4644 length:300 start_codon:yes stop_codon:yes gene_type:complete
VAKKIGFTGVGNVRNSFVRAFIEWAAKSVGQSYWAGLYYAQQKAKGNSHQSTVRALDYKWVRILFKCWKKGVAYDESKYLKASSCLCSKTFYYDLDGSS